MNGRYNRAATVGAVAAGAEKSLEATLSCLHYTEPRRPCQEWICVRGAPRQPKSDIPVPRLPSNLNPGSVWTSRLVAGGPLC